MCVVCKECICVCRWEFGLSYDRMVIERQNFNREHFCLLIFFYVRVKVVFFCSFNKPISFASLFAAISSFFDRFRKSEDWGPQSRSSDPSKQSVFPSQTSDISMQESGSDLQVNWSGLHRDILFGYCAAFFY